MRTLRAFLGRDLAYRFSSKISLFGQLFSMLAGAATLFFLGKMFASSDVPALRSFHGNYFAFALIGVIFARFQAVALSSFSDAIARDQNSGTLESILLTPASVPAIVIGASGSAFLFTAIQATLFLLIGAGVFGVNLAHANVPLALLVLILALFAISPIGIALAASVIAFRQGSSAIGVLSALTNVLGGVYFPVSLLPLPLKVLAFVFPITHGLNAVRAALLEGASLRAAGTDVVVLLCMAAVGLPASICLFRLAIRHALRVGSLTYY
jgi:ABC-2 type transport system permease protein